MKTTNDSRLKRYGPIFLILRVTLPALLILMFLHDPVHGFALDSGGRLYLGRSQGFLEVYENGAQVRNLRNVTTWRYSFTIEDDQLLIRRGNELFRLDLDGNLLSQGRITKNAFGWGKSFTDEAGNEYRMTSPFGRAQVVRNGTDLIYQVPTRDWLISLALQILVTVDLIVIPIWAFVLHRKSKKAKSAEVPRAAA